MSIRIPDILKQLRYEKGVKQEDVAKTIGISKSGYGYYEQGRSMPDPEMLLKLAKYFNVSVDYLLGRTDIKNVPAKDISNEDPESKLNKRDLKDIAKDVDSIMDKLDKGEAGPAYYNDIEMKEEDKELFRSAIELALKTIKVKNKETYTPKKYRKK
ncbi:helix-turn-helix domain-containing protein [Clostridium tyrobutyricum]|uniref:helix-turn-helix domain-containing protein n=1 Tax=Clostridium tyrobutyricum TaxID=1519 RepID=UPI00189F9AC8|nr:helix-turn-helix transcriptional regulator [Clostridium tyrobutyricum]